MNIKEVQERLDKISKDIERGVGEESDLFTAYQNFADSIERNFHKPLMQIPPETELPKRCENFYLILMAMRRTEDDRFSYPLPEKIFTEDREHIKPEFNKTRKPM